MFLNVSLILIFIFLSYFIFKSIREGEMESYYGKTDSSSFNDEPVVFTVLLVFYLSLWCWLAYLLYSRLNY